MSGGRPSKPCAAIWRAGLRPGRSRVPAGGRVPRPLLRGPRRPSLPGTGGRPGRPSGSATTCRVPDAHVWPSSTESWNANTKSGYRTKKPLFSRGKGFFCQPMGLHCLCIMVSGLVHCQFANGIYRETKHNYLVKTADSLPKFRIDPTFVIFIDFCFCRSLDR